MKKGFTLIELLAVIVILAIIALIATPIILNIIEDSRKSAMISSAKNYVDGLSKQVLNKNMTTAFNPSICTITNGDVTCDGISLNYQVNGKKPNRGTVVFDNGVITSYSLTFDDYTIVKNQNGTNIVEIANIEFNGILAKPTAYVAHKGIVYLDPTNLARTCNANIAATNLNSYSKSTGIKSGCMKFYIYDDSGSTYKMILDHNTSGNLPYSQSEINARLASDTAGWEGNPRLITANEIAEITGASSDSAIKWDSSKTYSSENIDIDTEVSGYNLYGSALATSQNYTSYTSWQSYSGYRETYKYSWLSSNLYNQSYGARDDNEYPYPTPTSETTAVITGYWTSDSVTGDSNKMWVVRLNWVEVSEKTSNSFGIRPVIELDKSIIDKEYDFNGTYVQAGQNDTHKGIVYMDPADPRITCTAQDAIDNVLPYYQSTTYFGVKTGCMKLYIYDDRGTDYKLLLNHCTTDQIGYDNDYGPGNTIKQRLYFDTEGWIWSPDLIGVDDVAHVVGADRNDTLQWDSSLPLGTNVGTQISWFYFDGSGNSYDGWQTRVANSTNKSNYGWLYEDLISCENNGCSARLNGNSYGYWTKDEVTGNSSHAWRVASNGSIESYYKNNSGNYSVRPVITIPKSYLSN